MEKNKFYFGKPIKRRSGVCFSNYRDYFDVLREDFQNRCCYCGSSNAILQEFEIDHFIPRRIFKENDNSLDCDYSNLYFCCKKCNRTKAGKYYCSPDNDTLKNERFYNPVEVDYNSIFYRDRFGIIHSDNKKGTEMIKDLRLYNPLFGLCWLLEKVYLLAKQIDSLSKDMHACAGAEIEISAISLNLYRLYTAFSRLINSSFHSFSR